MIQLESFIANRGLLVSDVRDDDYTIYKDVARTSETSSRANHDISSSNKSSLELDEPLFKDYTSALVSPSEFYSDIDYDAGGIIEPMEDGGASCQAHEPAVMANENVNSWVLDILNVSSLQAFGEGDNVVQVPSFDCDNFPSAQCVPGPLNEIEQSNTTILSSHSEITSARVGGESETAPSYHDYSESDEEVLLRLSNRMGN